MTGTSGPDGGQPDRDRQRPFGTLGQALREARQAKFVSLRDLARRLHTTHSNLSDYELGIRLASDQIVDGYERELDLEKGSLLRIRDDLYWQRAGQADGGDGPGPVTVLEGPASPEGETGEDADEGGRPEHAQAHPGGTPRLARRGALVLACIAVITGAGLFALHGERSRPRAPVVQVRVYNADLPCQEPRTEDCGMSLARDPSAPYGPANRVRKVWHGDVLGVECFVEGETVRSVRDENGMVMRRWYKVVGDQGGWLPAIRADPTTVGGVPPCAGAGGGGRQAS